MFTTSVKIRANRIPRIYRSYKKSVAYLVNLTAENMVHEAKHLCPVRTGYLRSTISAKVTPSKAEVGATAPYAGYVEFGTWKMGAQTSLRPSFDFWAPFFKKEMEWLMERMVAMS